MNLPREALLAKIRTAQQWDVIVIGGGASGLGVALDAVSRKLKVLLIEKQDFGSGTSSKSTKLVHGGVRYLSQGHISLVMEALSERKYILDKAPHLAHVQKFIIPIYSWLEAIKYYVGLKCYDFLAIGKSLGPTKWKSKSQVSYYFPDLKKNKLIGGIEYTDGAFDDSRLCIDLVSTISMHGGYCLNYMSCHAFENKDFGVVSISCKDELSGEIIQLKGSLFVNATGVYAERLLKKADIVNKFVIMPSQGSHVVTNHIFSPHGYGLMVPKTSDGRVLFAIPWKGKFLIGTTDVLQKDISEHPKPSSEEIYFILENLNNQLEGLTIDESDIAASFAGLRPLAAPSEESLKTKEVSRNHKILVHKNLLSVVGGKWTTFRKIGEDVLQKALKLGLINASESKSHVLTIEPIKTSTNAEPFLHPELPYTVSQIQDIITHEYVEHLSDLLCRRTRCSFISERATQSIAPQMASMLGTIKGWSDARIVEEINLFHQDLK
jgi:glycerol-3-phosphate dehydrogenase